MTSGVLYYFCGVKFAERLTVSLFTLRRWWSGPVTLIVTNQDCEEVGGRICRDPQIRADVKRTEILNVKHAAYVTKTLLPAWTPYDRTVYIDGDTVVVGKIDKLFDPEVALTQFSNWQTQGRKVSGRIKWWKGLSPFIDELIAEQLAESRPAINTGVTGWHGHGEAWAPTWHAMAVKGHLTNMTDEISIQLLSNRLEGVKVFDDRWNCSPIYGIGKQDARIWHFHGDKHASRNRAPQGTEIWWPCFEEALKANIGGISGWAGKFDPSVKELLQCQQPQAA